MSIRTRNPFTSVQAAGVLLPIDLLAQVADASSSIPGLAPENYHLDSGDRLSDAAARAWNVCSSAWNRFQTEFAQLPLSDRATTLTRDRFLLPLFRELGFGRLQSQNAIQIDDKSYPISHVWGDHVPIHLVSARLDLDRRQPGATGPNARSPYSLVQELLNRSPRHRWGMLSNGLKLYLLRDNNSLTRAANVEFDLKAIFENESVSDFKLLFNLCHQSRFEIAPDGRPEDCWLETWSKEAGTRGTRAREKLRKGVEEAINSLGSGFLDTRGNAQLKEALRSGQLDKQDFYRQLLRMVYRLLLLLVAENRKSESGQNLLHPIDTPDSIRNRYARFYSVDRLRSLAQIRKGTTHTDLYESLKLLFDKLRAGYSPLGIPGLGSFLFSSQSTPSLDNAQLTNEALLNAFRHLTITTDDAPRGRQRVQAGNKRAVDFANLGSDELGSVYESLLELHPEIETDRGSFHLSTASGNERKTSGSYYTPTSLIHCLLDSALDPVVHQALDKPTTAEAEKALLALKICDPACGSGHFLIAAAERLGKHLARLRTGDDEPSLIAIQHAKREVIGNCIYGVDLNPMSAELCKVSLWMEALEPGKPLSFLDHHIQVGNSLLGTTPELIEKGIPDEAFAAIEGDDKKVCSELRKRNKQEREQGYRTFQFGDEPSESLHLAKVAEAAFEINEMTSETTEQVNQKATKYQEFKAKSTLKLLEEAANAWCCAFVIPKVKSGPLQPRVEITHDIFRNLLENPHKTPWGTRQEIERLARQYEFFHWHLAFPEVFQRSYSPLTVPNTIPHSPCAIPHSRSGFDVILGNPPWERVKIQEKEWFAERSPAIANAPNAAARKRLIDQLITTEPALSDAFLADLRKAEGESHLMRNSGRYPLCGRGDINTYAIFAELNRNLTNTQGRTGMIVPSGVATDDTTKFFFQDLVDKRSLVSLFDFENKGIFPGVHSSYKFSLLTLRAPIAPEDESQKVAASEFVFFAHSVDELADPQKRFTLTPDEIALLNPNTRTCPIFRSKHDAELTKAIYRRVPVLIKEARDGQPEENPWGISFSRMFDMSNDSHLFRTREQLEAEGWELRGNVFYRSAVANGELGLANGGGGSDVDGEERYLPLYEAKMTNLFDHRHGNIVGSQIVSELSGIPAEPTTVNQHKDPWFFAMPRYWINGLGVKTTLGKIGWKKEYFINTRDVARGTDIRTAIQAMIPTCAVGHKAPLVLPFAANQRDLTLFYANLNMFTVDYVVRQKIGGASLSFFIIKQIPILISLFYNVHALFNKIIEQIVVAIIELTYTAWDLQPFAQDCNWDGPPFRWDEERRFQIRCELDAAFFHLYLSADEQGQWKPARVAEGAVRDETDKEFATLTTAFPTPRHAVDYIMETFPIVKRKDESAHGHYRTKQRILEIYDQMQQSIRTGTPYQAPLNPPPGPPTDEHGHFLSYTQINPADYPHIHPPRDSNESH